MLCFFILIVDLFFLFTSSAIPDILGYHVMYDLMCTVVRVLLSSLILLPSLTLPEVYGQLHYCVLEHQGIELLSKEVPALSISKLLSPPNLFSAGDSPSGD